MSINLTDEINVKTKKGKLGAAKQIFLEGDIQTVENEIQDINSRHNSLNTKHESLSRTVQGIAATGGASTATNVTYNNDASGLNAENAQDAIDELENKKFDKESIVHESGESDDKVMSQKAVSDKLSDLFLKLFGIQVFTASKSPIINNIRIFDNVKNGDKLTFRAEMSVDSYDQLYLGLYDKTTGSVKNIFKAYTEEYKRKSVCDSLVINDSRISDTVKLCINAYTGNNRYVENCIYSIGDNTVLSTLGALKFDKSDVVQELGNNTNKVVSQKKTTDTINNINDKLSCLFGLTTLRAYFHNNDKIARFPDVKNGDTFYFIAESITTNYNSAYIGIYDKSNYNITDIYKLYEISKIEDKSIIFDSFVVNSDKLTENKGLCLVLTNTSNRLQYVKDSVYSINNNSIIYILDKLKFDKSDVVQELGEAEDKVASQKAVNNAISNIGKAISNIGKLYTPISFLQNKIVDENLYNRLLISVYGDSIMGAQLDELDNVDGLESGNFPPNMHKKTHIWQLYNKYKLENEDTEFINLANAKWNKTGFSDTWINHFNKFEAYNPIVDNAEATITITGYKYFKLIWYQYYAGEHNGIITISVNGESYKKPSELSIDLPDELPIADFGNKINSYAICKLDKTKSYNIKIHIQKKSVNLAFWGCEVWNNPRIDFVNEAISGITAFNSRKTIGDTLIYNKYHKPLLAIYECLFINDSSYIKNSDHTLSDWLKANNEMIDLLKNKGIPILGILAHGVPTVFLSNYAKGIFINNDIYYIDIQESIKKDKVNVVSSKDGLHLSQIGNNYYFDKIDKVLSYKF